MRYDPLLYGKDSEERLVGVHLLTPSTVSLYTRTEQDRVTEREEAFSPFAFFTDTVMDQVEEAFAGLRVFRFKGAGEYNRVVKFRDWNEHWDVVNYVRKDDGLGRRDDVYYIASPEQQYLMQTGKTLYKGMTLESVKRMQVDIEVYSSTGAFPLASRNGDEVIIISLSDNRGWEKVLYLDREADVENGEAFHSERDLLRGFVREIHRQDPDILELHNGFGFDLDYLTERAELHGFTLDLGRNNLPARTWKSQKKFAERDVSYTNHQIAGRSVVDTMFFSMAFDVFTRELPDATLKGVADYFRKKDGVTYEEMHGRPRQYVAGHEISDMWRERPDLLISYALDDVRETRYLSDKLSGATFYLSQMLPMTYQEAHLAGSGKIIESIMVREYLHRGVALPKPETGVQQHGGYTDIFYTGRFRNIVYADVESLYPSIMLKYRCHPERDELGVHRSMLSQLTDLRLSVKAESKAAAKAGETVRAGVLKAMEQSYKVIINSQYGVMGDKWSLFNDFSEADRVATTGQALLRRMIDIIERNFGGTVIECDTDGVLYVCREELHGDLEAQEAEVRAISEMMPEGINVGMDGLFDVLISVAKKNYALRDYNGKVKTKGGAFKSRGLEKYGRDYLDAMLEPLMDGDVAAMHRIHEATKKRIAAADWTVEDFETRKNLKDDIGTYLDKVERGGNRQAQYEVAIREGERTGRSPLKGDSVAYYISGSKKGYRVSGFVDAKPSWEWRKGDENTVFYLRRLGQFAGRFKLFFAPEDFERIFSNHIDLSGTGDLFGGAATPDFSGTEIVSKRVE